MGLDQVAHLFLVIERVLEYINGYFHWTMFPGIGFRICIVEQHLFETLIQREISLNLTIMGVYFFVTEPGLPKPCGTIVH